MSPALLSPARRLEVQDRDSIVRAAFMPQTFRQVDDGLATVEVILSAGAAVRRLGWFDGGLEEFDEVLSFEQGAHRDERLLSGRLPLVLDHQTRDARSVVGVLADPRWDRAKRTLQMTAKLSRTEGDRDVVQKIRDGILSNTSIGYQTFQVRDVTKKGDARRTIEAIDWSIYECSVLAVGADAGAHLRHHSAHETRTLIFASRTAPMDPETVPATGTPATVPATPPAPATSENRSVTTAPTPAAPAPVAPPAPSAEQVRAAALDAELGRQRAIRERLTAASLPLDGALATELLNDRNVTADAASTRILQHLHGRSSSSEVSPVATGAEEGVTLSRAVQSAVLYRMNRPELIDGWSPTDRNANERLLQGNPFLHRTLLEVGTEFLSKVHGVRGLERLAKLDRAGAILRPRVSEEVRSLGIGHSTSDFPGILANVANKLLRQAYDLTPETWSQWTTRGTLTDFKEAKRLQLGHAPRLLKVVEGAEYKWGTMGEMNEPIVLATYGRIVGFTRQAMVNDDLDAFSRLMRQFGASAAQLVADLVYAHITGNTVMADSVALFHATHKNLVTGSGNALGVTGLSNVRVLARKQTSIDSGLAGGDTPFYQSVNLVHLRVPPELETTAQQLTAAIQPALVGSVNPFQGTFRSVAAEPRLTDTTDYFLFADPAALDTIEVAFLQGQDGPTLESRIGFERDGMDIKARIDVGTSPIEFRGMYKNEGTT